jgi:PKD repeat protein
MSYFPTGDEDDGRFLHVAGNNLETLANEKIVAYIGVPRTMAGFCVAFFDGDVGGAWDIGTNSPDTILYTLIADGMRDGTGSRVVMSWTSAMMADDDWSEFCQPVDADAKAPSGNHFYRLEVQWQSPASADDLNGFKLRSDAQVSIAVQKIGFIAAPLNLGLDPAVLTGDPDPATNDAGANSYDGSWEFHAYLSAPGAAVNFREGDADRGDDTDDADTPNVDPDGATGPAQAEGANMGQPSDDTSPYPNARIAGAVDYQVVGPDGMAWANGNPSGNREWENFGIARADGTSLPAGFYDFKVSGLDAHNAVYIEPPGDLYADERPPLPVENKPPVADAGPDRTADRVTGITFDGSGSSDPENGIVDYSWAFGDGTGASGQVVVHTYGSLGTFTATLTVTDSGGLTASDTAVVLVMNRPPVADAGPDFSAPKRTPITFDGSGSSDPDAGIVSWDWDFGDGTMASGQVVVKAYAFRGCFTVILKVTDTDGASAWDQSFGCTFNAIPIANAGPDVSTPAGFQVSFDGTASRDPDGSITSYSWNFGDGTGASGAMVSHVYAAVGTYTVTLTVRDDDGDSALDTATVTVSTPPPAAPASPGGSFGAAPGATTDAAPAGESAPVDMTPGLEALGPLAALTAGLGAAALGLGQGLSRFKLK